MITTPFANECRAFARLNSRDQNGTWAVRCHGWMKLSDTQFQIIRSVVKSSGLSRWVVVKDYMPLSTTPSDIPTIYANFNISKDAKILPQNVRLENYRGSKIVDLSSALTTPSAGLTKFMFDYFYEGMACGVFDWFEDGQQCPCPRHDDLNPQSLP